MFVIFFNQDSRVQRILQSVADPGVHGPVPPNESPGNGLARGVREGRIALPMEGADIFCCWALIWHSRGTRGCADGVFRIGTNYFLNLPRGPSRLHVPQITKSDPPLVATDSKI